MTGLDLRDFFDSVQVLVVEKTVIASAVPHYLTGRFLPVTDPHIRKAAA